MFSLVPRSLTSHRSLSDLLKLTECSSTEEHYFGTHEGTNVNRVVFQNLPLRVKVCTQACKSRQSRLALSTGQSKNANKRIRLFRHPPRPLLCFHISLIDIPFPNSFMPTTFQFLVPFSLSLSLSSFSILSPPPPYSFISPRCSWHIF